MFFSVLNLFPCSLLIRNQTFPKALIVLRLRLTEQKVVVLILLGSRTDMETKRVQALRDSSKEAMRELLKLGKGALPQCSLSCD